MSTFFTVAKLRPGKANAPLGKNKTTVPASWHTTPEQNAENPVPFGWARREHAEATMAALPPEEGFVFVVAELPRDGFNHVYLIIEAHEFKAAT